jgi:hypothetical protein
VLRARRWLGDLHQHQIGLTMNRETIIEKIKKLLRMKRGGTPDEIATALRLAQELAAKHGIDINAVNPDVTEKPIQHGDEVLGRRVSFECKYASLIVDQFFKVSVFQTVNDVRSKYVFRFVGESWDIEIATYVYRFLCGHLRRTWTKQRGRLRNRQAFLWGMYLGICAKLRDLQPKTVDEPGLVKVDRQLQRRKDYIDKHFGKLSSASVEPDDDAKAARWSGFLAGQKTEIRSGVNGSKPSEKLTSGALQLTNGQ